MKSARVSSAKIDANCAFKHVVHVLLREDEGVVREVKKKSMDEVSNFASQPLLCNYNTNAPSLRPSRFTAAQDDMQSFSALHDHRRSRTHAAADARGLD